jgi:hypothetical protein
MAYLRNSAAVDIFVVLTALAEGCVPSMQDSPEFFRELSIRIFIAIVLAVCSRVCRWFRTLYIARRLLGNFAKDATRIACCKDAVGNVACHQILL